MVVLRPILRRQIDATVTFFHERVKIYGHEPLSGSPAALEQTAEHDRELDSPISDHLVRAAWAVGFGQLVHAADHLSALHLCAAEPTLAWAPATLARGAIESDCRALWLVDPRIQYRERVSRFLELHYIELGHLGRLGLTAQDGKPTHQSQRDIDELIARAGLRSREWKGVEAVLKSVDQGAAHAWSLYSKYAHATTASFQAAQALELARREGEQGDADREIHGMVSWPLILFDHGTTALAHGYGWDEAEGASWTRSLHTALDACRPPPP